MGYAMSIQIKIKMLMITQQHGYRGDTTHYQQVK